MKFQKLKTTKKRKMPPVLARAVSISSNYARYRGTNSYFSNKTQISRNPLANTNSTRSVQISCGRIKKSGPDIVPGYNKDEPQIVQSDRSGHHYVATVTSCTDKQCHNKQCDTVHEKVCALKNEETATSTTECAGALTHKIPLDKSGIELSVDDIKGETKQGSQKIVTEKTTIPFNKDQVQKNEAATEYVQREDIAKKIIKNLPENSPVKLKETSESYTPKDDEI